MSIWVTIGQVHADVFVDRGGAISEYVRFVERTYKTHELVEIRGRCYSACTIELGAENVCIAEDATLFFHSARVTEVSFDSSEDSETRVTMGYVVAAGNRDMLTHYPPRIRRWVEQHHALSSLQFTQMSGREAIRLGVRQCRS